MVGGVKLTELEIAKTSPALTWKSDRKKNPYPSYFHGKVPLKIKMVKTAKPDVIFKKEHIGMKANQSEEYYAWVNSYGAVSAIMPNGQQLGLIPGEFEVTEFHEEQK